MGVVNTDVTNMPRRCSGCGNTLQSSVFAECADCRRRDLGAYLRSASVPNDTIVTRFMTSALTAIHSALNRLRTPTHQA